MNNDYINDDLSLGNFSIFFLIWHNIKLLEFEQSYFFFIFWIFKYGSVVFALKMHSDQICIEKMH